MSWEQMRAILWLRWRLSANRFVREGSLNAVLSILGVGLLGTGAVGCAAAGFVTGWLVLGKAAPVALLAVWDGVLMVFLIFWLIGLMVEIQRSESIDINKLLHLPVTPSQVFVFNYLASHLTPSLILFLPGMLGLCAGMVLSAGPRFVLMIPTVLAFVFMLTAWTYCLRGWLAALMVNKRRRRAVIVWTTIVFVAVAQVPNLLLNSSFFHAKTKSHQRATHSLNWSRGQLPEVVMQAHLLVPPGWVGYSAVTLKTGSALPAAAAAAAAGLIGLLGLMRAYRLTLRFYQGFQPGSAKARVRKARGRPAGVPLVERSLPWVADDTAALALATFRGLLRAPELKMAFITPLVFAVVFGSLGLSRARHVPPAFLGGLGATAAALIASFSFAPTMSNTFGLDRDGFRALILLPTPRRQVLFAKNLAFLPFVLGTGILMLLVATLVLRLGLVSLLTGLLQLPMAFMLFCLVCNVAAIVAPYRFSPGTLQARKPKPIVILANFVVFLTVPFVALPLVTPPGLQIVLTLLGFPGWFPVSLAVTAVLLVAVGFVYWHVLPAEGALLQKRELTILQRVTEENE